MSDRCYYFGYRAGSGFCLQAPGDQQLTSEERHLQYFVVKGEMIHLDGALAPKRMARTREIVWEGKGKNEHERTRIQYNSTEMRQGLFLRHELSTGFTAISWWDRCQGDSRGNCSGTLLLEGKRTSRELIEALKRHFPKVVENMTKAGVQLIEVQPGLD